MTNSLIKQCISISQHHRPKHSQYRNYLHYSFIIQSNRLIEWGTNLAGCPPLYFGYHSRVVVPKLHSELVAYRKARGILNDGSFEVLNIRLTRTGSLKVSAPCPVCQQWLRSVGCTTVWFSTEFNFGKLKL